MGSECTLCISKIFSGRPRTPPPPYCERKKNSPLWLYMILYSKGENSPASRISKIGELHTIFWEKIDTNSTKNGLRMHHSHPFFKKNSRGRSPGPPPEGRGYPLPHPPPAALRADLVIPPPPPTPSVDPLDPPLVQLCKYV